jgi:hypothetical protein
MFQFTIKYTSIIYSKAQNLPKIDPNWDFGLKPSGNPGSESSKKAAIF